jgi:hypothetical protein
MAGQEKKAWEQAAFLIQKFPDSRYRPMTLFCLGNRKIIYEADLDGAWSFYDQLMNQYPSHSLTGEARKYWAKVQNLPKEELKRQVDDFVTKIKKRKQS